MITPKDTIGYIVRVKHDNSSDTYEFMECKVKKVVMSKKSTKVYTKELYPLDIEEIEGNREEMDTFKCVLITEPFVMREGDSEYFKRVVDDFNKNGAKSILD